MVDEAKPRTSDEDDAALVRHLRGGDARAFDRVYLAYHRRVFTFLLRLSGRRDTAEDLAQETWIKFAKAAPQLREDTRLAPFVFTIARNGYLSYRRWAMLDLSRLVVVGFETLTIASSGATPDVEHERARELALLEVALGALPVAAREVLLLVGVEGLEQDEVARVLGISHEAMRQRLSRSRTLLAEKMAKLEKREPAGRHDPLGAKAKARAERGEA